MTFSQYLSSDWWLAYLSTYISFPQTLRKIKEYLGHGTICKSNQEAVWYPCCTGICGKYLITQPSPQHDKFELSNLKPQSILLYRFSLTSAMEVLPPKVVLSMHVTCHTYLLPQPGCNHTLSQTEMAYFDIKLSWQVLYQKGFSQFHWRHAGSNQVSRNIQHRYTLKDICIWVYPYWNTAFNDMSKNLHVQYAVCIWKPLDFYFFQKMQCVADFKTGQKGRINYRTYSLKYRRQTLVYFLS